MWEQVDEVDMVARVQEVGMQTGRMEVVLLVAVD